MPTAQQIARMQRQRDGTYGLINPDAFNGGVTFAAVKAALAVASSSVSFNAQQITIANGTTAGAGVTAGQTYYLPPSTPGVGVVLPSIAGAWFPWGGNVATPNANEVFFTMQPRDRTKPPFALYGTVGLFQTTYDYVMALGFNRSNEQVASPSGAWVIEADYEESAGVHKSEGYFEWLQVGGTYGARPFFTSLDWTTGVTTVGHEFGKAASTAGFWAVSSANNGLALKALDGGVQVVRDSFAIFDQAITYAAESWTPAGGFNLYDEPAYGGARRFTTGNAKHTISGNVSGITDPVAQSVIRQLLDALNSLGMDMIVDTTT